MAINVRGHKYGAKPIVIDGIRFASQKEGRRYQDLKLLERAGEIWNLELQPRFPLSVPSTTGTVLGAAKAIAGTFDGRIGEYRADFAYCDKRHGRIVEDVKGFKTPLYKWKKKHVEKQYGIRISEV
jgi:hypothetical protein